MWVKGHTIFQPRLPRLKPRNDIKRSTALILTFSLILGLALPIIGLITPPTAKASVGDWWNEDYRYRLPLDITSSTAQSNVYYQLSLDTTTNFNPDCSDLRFITESGQTIPHHLVSGCTTNNTLIQLLFSNLPSSTTPIYLYYANPEAQTIATTTPFNNPASGVTHTSQPAQQSPAPLAHWKFDEGYGSTTNSSATTNYPATLNNGPTWQPPESCPSGKCLYFDGVDDYVATTSTADLAPAQFSLAVWIKATRLSGAQAIVVKAGMDAMSKNYALSLVNGQYQFTTFSGVGSVAPVTGRTIALNTWTHVAATWDSSYLKLYENGSLIYKRLSPEVMNVASMQRLTLGGRPDFADDPSYFQGFLDDPKIYTYPRTQQQIQYDYTQGIQSLNQQQANLTNGLVGHWAMDEQSWNGTSGEVKDRSGNQKNGRATNGTTLAPGRYGSSGQFDGTVDQLISTGSYAQDTFTQTSSLTFSIWIKPTSYPSSWRGGIALLGTYLQDGYRVGLGQDGKVWFWASQSGGTLSLSSISSIPLSQWTHLVMVYDNTQTKLYIDGRLDNKSTTGEIIFTSSLPHRLGVFDYATPSLTGSLDEARLYNRTLTQPEITQLYTYAPPPVAYYDFEEGSGNTLQDKSTNNHPGTWSGTGDRYTKGQLGKAGSFNGSNTRVKIPSSSFLDWTSSFTISAWINPTVLGNQASNCYDKRAYIIASAVDNGTGSAAASFGIEHSQTGKIFVRVSGTGISEATPFAMVTATNQWHHISVSVDSVNKTISLTLNGTATVSHPYTTHTLGTNGDYPIFIGGSPHSCYNSYFQGSIDQVKIYNYASSPAQILADMQSTNPNQLLPLAHYNLNENSATTAHNTGLAGSSLNATLSNMASPPTSTSGWTPNSLNQSALTFDGINDFLSTPHPPSLNIPSTGDYAISLWLKTTQATPARIINKLWSEAGVGEHGWLVDINTATPGSIRMRLADQPAHNYDFATPATNINNGSWHHLVINLNYQQQAKAEVYLDSQLIAQSATLPFHPTLTNTTASLGLATIPSLDGQYFNGSLDEVKIYNSALTPQQIAVDYNQSSAQVIGSPSTEPTLTGSGNNSSKPSSSQSSTYCIPGSLDYCTPPVAHYNFEEGSGSTLKDVSGHNKTATFTGNPPIWSSGKHGKSLDFSQIGSTYATIPTSLDSPDAWTYSVWLYPTGNPITTNDGILGQGNNPRLTWGIPGAGGQKVQVLTNWSESPGWRTANSPDLNLNQWHHLEAVFDRTNLSNQTITLYVNGQQVTQTITTTGYLNRPGGTHFIGRRDTSYGLPGQIDEVKIYDYARTPSQVAWDYNNGAPIAHYKLDECSGTTIHDSSGNNYHGALSLGSLGTTTIGTCTTLGTAWSLGRIGKHNSSMSFDGEDDHIDIGVRSEFNAQDITISGWIKPQAPEERYWVGQGGVGGGWGIARNTVGAIVFLSKQINNENAVVGYSGSSNVVPIDSWTHVSVTAAIDTTNLSNNKVQIYINGVKQSTIIDRLALPVLPVTKFRIGARGSWGTPLTFWKGQIDDLQIFNYALTDKQIQTLYNNGAVYWGR